MPGTRLPNRSIRKAASGAAGAARRHPDCRRHPGRTLDLIRRESRDNGLVSPPNTVIPAEAPGSTIIAAAASAEPCRKLHVFTALKVCFNGACQPKITLRGWFLVAAVYDDNVASRSVATVVFIITRMTTLAETKRTILARTLALMASAHLTL